MMSTRVLPGHDPALEQGPGPGPQRQRPDQSPVRRARGRGVHH